MAQKLRVHSLSLLFVAGCLAPLPLGACGGGAVGEKPPEVAPPPASASNAVESADAGSPSSAAVASAAPTETAAPSAAAPPAAKATKKTDAAWATCHSAFKPKSKDVSKEVASLGKGCARATGMKPVGKTLSGKQSDSGGPQTFPLQAEANHCYRVYAQGTEGIKDLDVGIKDSTGSVVGEDSSDSSTAVVTEDGAVCFKEADAASIVVSVGLGSGTYAVQVWED